jgi:cytochrome c553
MNAGVKSILAILLLLFGGGAAIAQNQSHLDAGKELFELRGCEGCHGLLSMGSKPEVPFLAGQQPGYLANQFMNFRLAGDIQRGGFKLSERHHAAMSPNARPMNNFEIADLAAYLHSLPCARVHSRPPPPPPPLAAKCEYCHGAQGRSPFTDFPSLAGQKEGYLRNQLREFRDATQHYSYANARSHRLMMPMALDLDDAEIEQMAKYYSNLSCRVN